MSAKRTPGPWTVDPRFPDAVRSASGTIIFVGTTDNADKEANARFISAAPDMEIALEAALVAWGAAKAGDIAAANFMNDAETKMKAALALARAKK